MLHQEQKENGMLMSEPEESDSIQTLETIRHQRRGGLVSCPQATRRWAKGDGCAAEPLPLLGPGPFCAFPRKAIGAELGPSGLARHGSVPDGHGPIPNETANDGEVVDDGIRIPGPGQFPWKGGRSKLNRSLFVRNLLNSSESGLRLHASSSEPSE